MELRAFDTLKKILVLHGEEAPSFNRVDVRMEREEDEKNNPSTSFNIYKTGNTHVFFALQGKMIAERDIDKAMRVQTGRWILVTNSPPSASVQQRIRYEVEKKKRVYLFHIHQLQFDITTHRMAVPHRILKDDEKTALFKKYKITDPHEQLPWIDSQDAMARWHGAVPGDVVEITRHSDTGGPSLYWRYCVSDANLN
jgi:DNA-directed RNA polymerase subunit H (RpoH/RPB5)